MCSTCFPRSVLSADASLPFTGSSGASSPASTVLSQRCDFLPSIPPRFVAFAWRYLGCTRSFRSSADECAAKAWSWSPGGSSREDAEETTGSPKFLGNPNCPFAHVPHRRRQDRDTRPLRCRDMALGHRTAKAPAKGLSTLNSMAFGLAVYASQFGLPRPTQNSLPAAGQALPGRLSTRKVPMKGFRFASYISFSPPKLSWRNR